MELIIYHDYLNIHNERIQLMGDIMLNLDYWDCECTHNFIHSISVPGCGLCGSIQDESPSSRENEVAYFFDNDHDG